MKKWEYFVLKMYRLNDLDFPDVIQPRFIPAIIQQSFLILKIAENPKKQKMIYSTTEI